MLLLHLSSNGVDAPFRTRRRLRCAEPAGPLPRVAHHCLTTAQLTLDAAVSLDERLALAATILGPRQQRRAGPGKAAGTTMKGMPHRDPAGPLSYPSDPML